MGSKLCLLLRLCLRLRQRVCTLWNPIRFEDKNKKIRLFTTLKNLLTAFFFPNSL